MTSDNMSQYFGKDLEAMSFAINYHKWILSEFLPYLNGNVAEIGAGIGSFSSLLLETQIRSLKAFEPSQNMFPLLQKSLGRNEKAIAINKFFGRTEIDELFDSIVYVNVLEHIENDEKEIAIIYDALKINGFLLIFVPALPSLFSELDKKLGHFRRYFKSDLIKLIQQSGFCLIKARYFDIAGIIPWYINFVLLKNSMNAESVSIYDRFVVPIMRIVEQIVSPPIGKNILLIAKKV